MTRTKERKLWFDGPNYTADAIVIDPAAASILLIQRGDTGEWALPGGFVDHTDTSSSEAAAREALEEADISLDSEPSLIFRGIVDDPRNTETAWIETSAHLFAARHTQAVSGKDDAVGARWHDLANLPPLYASHGMIVNRALDYLASSRLIEAASSPDSRDVVDGGHMEYDKYIFTKDDTKVFAKQHDSSRYSDPEKYQRGYLYLEKEAFTMAHLRQHGFTGLPRQSILHNTTLAMNALHPEDGWRWRADSAAIDAYVQDAAATFSQLEAMPVPADSFVIEPSYSCFLDEGWRTLDHDMAAALEQRAADFMPRLTIASQETAAELLTQLPDLQRAGVRPRQRQGFVFCHHDVRQSNLAWHPDHGTKLVDWSWAGLGEPGSDITSLLIDLHKSNHDITPYRDLINPQHCLTLMGFWLNHSTWPCRDNDDTVRFQQFLSALSAYEVLRTFSFRSEADD